jgi:phosphohistidine phosphatase
MTLYILRHGIAVDRTSFSGTDADRSLTAAGRRKMHRIARGMKTLGITVDLVLSSPLARARETATIMAAELGCSGRLRFSPHLKTGGDTAALIADIARRGAEAVVLVGHEPQVSALVSILVSGGQRVELKFKKGGLCRLSINAIRYGRCAVLDWFLTPSQLAGLR